MRSSKIIVILKEWNQKKYYHTKCSCSIDGLELLFDYDSNMYRLGINPELMYYFNEEDIDKVIFKGYKDVNK